MKCDNCDKKFKILMRVNNNVDDNYLCDECCANVCYNCRIEIDNYIICVNCYQMNMLKMEG